MARIRPARNDGSSKDDGSDTPPAPPARARRSGSKADRAKQPPRPTKSQPSRTKTGSVTKEVQDQRKGSRFISDVIAELRKVQWPTRPQLMQSTAVVILVVAIVTIYLDIIDSIVSRVVHAIF